MHELTLSFPLNFTWDLITDCKTITFIVNDHLSSYWLLWKFSIIMCVMWDMGVTPRFLLCCWKWIQLPPQFNIPKSQLQCYGESVYCFSSNMLSKCAEEETSLNRLISVVAWSISTVRPLAFGVAPYNSILGETHHVSRGSLNVLVEQV